MPGIDAIRPIPLRPPRESQQMGNPRTAPAESDQPRADSVELSQPLRLIQRPSEPLRAKVADENARASQAPEPALLANQYGRAAVEQSGVRFFAVDGGRPGPLEIIDEEV